MTQFTERITFSNGVTILNNRILTGRNKNMRTFKQLDYMGQIKAIDDYIQGWRETHPKESPSFAQMYQVLVEDDESRYDQDGNYCEDGEVIEGL